MKARVLHVCFFRGIWEYSVSTDRSSMYLRQDNQALELELLMSEQNYNFFFFGKLVIFAARLRSTSNWETPSDISESGSFTFYPGPGRP